MSDRFKRICAFVLDWNIILFPVVIVNTIISAIVQQAGENYKFVGMFGFLLILLALGAVILRDVIFRGRSLGKRILGLYILDKDALTEVTAIRRFLKNLFLFIYPIDAILLLATGETIGDRVANTTVASKKSLEKIYVQESTVVTEQITYDKLNCRKKNIKSTIRVVSVVVVGVIAFIGFIQVILNSKKDTEEYKIAYNYLISSEAFEVMNVNEEKIRMNTYKFNTNYSADGTASQTVTIGFKVNGESLTVICHNENDVWQVCKDCTTFE